MKIIENNFIPFNGFKAMQFCGLLFVRKGAKMTIYDLNHEKIHLEQQKELLFVSFFAWYMIEWIIRLFMPGRAYYKISFEQETYENQYFLDYLKRRKRYSFIKWLKI